MSRFQEGSLLRLKRKTGPDAWVFRWYEEISGERKYRKSVIGTVDRLPTRHDAEGAILSLRRNINSEQRAPETVSELITHYRKHELVPERKAFATIESTGHYLKRHIEAKFGSKRLLEIRTVDVEKWLHSLNYAPGTRSKIRNIMSALFNHAMRHEWMDRNPITKVRTSAKRLRETDVLTPAEFAALLPELKLRERTMVVLAGSTGLRRSELVALTWSDIDLELMQVNVRRSCVRNHFGDTKTEASRKPVPLHPSVAKTLAAWREETPYPADDDFVFASWRLHGKKPVTPDMVLEEGDSTRARKSRHYGEGHRLAQLPPFACDQPSCGRGRFEDGSRTASSRQLADHAGGVYEGHLFDQAGSQRPSDADVSGCGKEDDFSTLASTLAHFVEAS